MAEVLKLKRIVDIEYNDITIDSNLYHDKLRVFLKDGKSMGRCIVMTIFLIHVGKEFLPTPNISIMARKTI
ncbi:MAG: hypothetical protein WC556_09190 [Candidatus Methanoperedens sp.]